MLDNTARMLSTIGIWVAVGAAMIFGFCQMHWSGDSAEFALVVIIAIVFGSAATATKYVWRNAENKRENALHAFPVIPGDDAKISS